MNRVIKYDIVEAPTIDLLVEQVQSRIGKGWQPLSGPFYLNGSHFQAVVWTAESDAASHPHVDEYYQSEIELIDELTEDDQSMAHWEVGVDDSRNASRR